MSVAHQAPLSMRFSGQEYWSDLPFPSPEDLPTQGLNLGLPHCRQGSPENVKHQGLYFDPRVCVCVCVCVREGVCVCKGVCVCVCV